MPKRPQTTTAKGLGWRHKQQRERLFRNHIEGSACELCGRGMFRDPLRNFDQQPLHADHSKPRATHGVHQLADRLTHGSCDARAGQRLGQALLGRSVSDDTEPEPTRLVFPWP